MKIINLNLGQPFNAFVEEAFKKAKETKNLNLNRACLAFMHHADDFADKTVIDVLRMTSKGTIGKYRNTGPKSYGAFCKLFASSQIKMTGLPFFKEHLLFEKEAKRKQSAKEDQPPLVTIKAVVVRTDPQTTVFQIVVDGGKAGVWKEAANTPREAEMFLKGLQARNCFTKCPMLKLPTIPKPE